MWPSRSVKCSPLERIDTRHIWQCWVRQHAYACDEKLRGVALAALVCDYPSMGMESGRLDLGVELDVLSETKFVAYVIDVALCLGLRCKVL